jgi:trans-2,3-dihydro-3-hydroxyanthranilate isomerase
VARSPLRFHTLDVFTDRAFTGNPLAVVEDADALAEADMQRIAREFNLSETIFLQSPRDPINTARVRIFTPASELPFAGHPIVGAAVLLAQTRAAEMLTRNGLVIALETGIGAIRCEVIQGKNALAPFAEFELARLPEKLGEGPDPQILAQALSLDVVDVGFGAHMPSQYAAGVPFAFVPLRSREALDRARRAPGPFATALNGLLGAYLYTIDANNPSGAVHARMFANGVGIDEDPATGSAAAAFAGVALEFERPADGAHEIVIEQGSKMGRPSRITLRMNVAGGRLASAHIGGCAVRISEGTMWL